MSHSPGLFTRNGTFYLRYIIPKKHQQAFGGRTRIVQSLETSSKLEARKKALLLRAQLASTPEHPLASHRQALLSTCEPATPAAHLSLRSLLTQWRQTKQPSQDTYRACQLAVEAYLQLHGLHDVAVADMTRQDGQRFATALLSQCQSRKTAHGKLTWVKSLLNFAVDTLDQIPKSPWRGIEIKYSKTTQRRIWSDPEITKLLTATHHLAHSAQAPKRCGGVAAYWLPLLALHTGARLSELAQLTPSDISQEPDGYWLTITDAGEGQTIKSTNANRKIPLHSNLLRVGFIDYWLTQRNQPSLWPQLPKRQGRAGGYFSNWFSQLVKTIGLENLDFHSFRHTFRTKLVLENTPEAIIDALMGHAAINNIGKSRYTHVTSALRSHINQIQYITAQNESQTGCLYSTNFKSFEKQN